MTSIYLSSTTPHWQPKTEGDIRNAVDGGLLSESSRLDAKKELLTKGDNKELARDLASFAIDSGTLIIGIGEDKEQRRFTLEPQKLDGLAEKIDQVARTIPDPPLSIITEEIPAADTTLGYVLVHIPANPQAPHMVDGRYYGRNDKTKHVLTDADVARLHARRRSGEQDALALLAHEMGSDPMRGVGDQAHLFLVAQPLAGQEDMLLDLTSGQDWNSRLYHFLTRSDTSELSKVLDGAGIAPDLGDATNGSRRAGGAARSSPCLADGRVYKSDGSLAAQDAIEVQVFEDGGLRLFQSRLSAAGHSGEQVILDAAPVNLLRRFLALVTAAADESGYLGSWALAVGATGLRGKVAHSTTNAARFFAQSPMYDQDVYRRATAASWEELTASPGGISRRLIGPLLRTLGCEERWMQALTDSEPSA
ncbi:ATP-binding protein [Streptomyces sp. ODS28]|uniref:AlbA family DNA-binding domain-containing protein n=1 Tax=Streptomyces sp. ODS28 TaxID=3136688 RepID=UPI0031E9059B